MEKTAALTTLKKERTPGRARLLSFKRELPPLQRRLIIGSVLTVFVGAALTCFLISIKYDTQTVWEFSQIFKAFEDVAQSESIRTQVGQRVIKTCAMVLAVCAIAVGGLIMQNITRNDLASPEIMGMTGSAKLGLTLLVIYAPGMASGGKYAITMIAAALPVCILLAVTASTKRSPSGLTLAFTGISLGIVFTSAEWFVKYNKEEAQLFVQEFLNDSFRGQTVSDLRFFSPFIVAPIGILLLLSRQFTLLEGGSELASSVGARTSLTRSLGALSVVVMVPAALLVGANLLLVGIAVPHIAKALLRTKNYAILTLGTCAIGIIFITLANLISSFASINIGGLMAVIAAPAFIWLARKMKA